MRTFEFTLGLDDHWEWVPEAPVVLTGVRVKCRGTRGYSAFRLEVSDLIVLSCVDSVACDGTEVPAFHLVGGRDRVVARYSRLTSEPVHSALACTLTFRAAGAP